MENGTQSKKSHIEMVSLSYGSLEDLNSFLKRSGSEVVYKAHPKVLEVSGTLKASAEDLRAYESSLEGRSMAELPAEYDRETVGSDLRVAANFLSWDKSAVTAIVDLKLVDEEKGIYSGRPAYAVRKPHPLESLVRLG